MQIDIPNWMNTMTESQVVDAVILQKTLERKKITQELALLQETQKQAQADLKKIIDSAEETTKKVQNLKQEMIFLEKAIINGSQETHDFIIHCMAILRESVSKVDTLKKVALEVEKQAINATETLKNAQGEAKALHEVVVREGVEMDRQKSDLDIYHERLKAYFKEHLPNQQVII
jgi:predicted TIM-barrel fold metal-dependent hydrolase